MNARGLNTGTSRDISFSVTAEKIGRVLLQGPTGPQQGAGLENMQPNTLRTFIASPKIVISNRDAGNSSRNRNIYSLTTHTRGFSTSLDIDYSLSTVSEGKSNSLRDTSSKSISLKEVSFRFDLWPAGRVVTVVSPQKPSPLGLGLMINDHRELDVLIFIRGCQRLHASLHIMVSTLFVAKTLLVDLDKQ